MLVPFPLMILTKRGELTFCSLTVVLHHVIRLWMQGSRSGVMDPKQGAYLLEH